MTRPSIADLVVGQSIGTRTIEVRRVDVVMRRVSRADGAGEVAQVLTADSKGRGARILPARERGVDSHADGRQRVSRCAVCFPQRGQNFDSSRRSGSLRRFFLVM